MIRKLKQIVLFFTVVIYLVFEELVWERAVAPIYRFIERLHLYEDFLAYVKNSADRYVVLVLFVLPFLLGEGLGILSGLLAARLYIVAAIIVYLLKIPLVVLAFAILKNAEEKLHTFVWFMYSHKFVLKVIDKLKNSSAYLAVKNLVVVLKNRIVAAKNKILASIRRYLRS